jgi:hypothetical protein
MYLCCFFKSGTRQIFSIFINIWPILNDGTLQHKINHSNYMSNIRVTTKKKAQELILVQILVKFLQDKEVQDLI